MVVPVLLVVGSDPQTSFLVSALAIWINDFVVVMLIFGNFVWRVYQFDKKNRDMSNRNLSVMQSRVAIRASIVAFARDTKGGALIVDSKPKRRSDRRSVRFSEMVSENGVPSKMKDSWSRFQLEEEDCSIGNSGEMTTNEGMTEVNSVTEEGQMCESAVCTTMFASDSLDEGDAPDEEGRELRKGKSDSDIILSRDLQKGMPDSEIMPRQSLASISNFSDLTWRDPSAALGGNENDGGSLPDDETFEKPDFSRQRSHSLPSLTALTEAKRTESGHRIGPDLPGHRFQEILQATFGDRAALTAETRLAEGDNEDDEDESNGDLPLER